MIAGETTGLAHRTIAGQHSNVDLRYPETSVRPRDTRPCGDWKSRLSRQCAEAAFRIPPTVKDPGDLDAVARDRRRGVVDRVVRAGQHGTMTKFHAIPLHICGSRARQHDARAVIIRKY